MNKIVKLAAVASIVAISSSASAFWGNGYNMGDMANDFFGDAFGDGTGDFNMNMNASGRGNGRGQGRGYDRFAYQGYGNPYAYGPYGAPYGYGALTAPPMRRLYRWRLSPRSLPRLQLPSKHTLLTTDNRP